MRERQIIDSAAAKRRIARSAHPQLYRIIFGLDAWLSRWALVTEYSSDPRCIFRIHVGQLDQDVALSDGTVARGGDRVVDLHLWNEHVPLMPKHGATIAWLRQMCFCMEVSLRELEKHLMVRPLLDNVSILRANFIFAVSEQSIQMVRLSQRYGFEPISAPPPLSMLQRAYQLGENVLISLMARASSAQSLERGTLRRDRTQVFLPRRLLARRYRESDRSP